ncbi:MAG: phosphodiester glycosidase family protein [Verrucomicrobia bacterium]|nr:phosphodiester glycosidase family protein [Verrucomicrobiota bacterium]
MIEQTHANPARNHSSFRKIVRLYSISAIAVSGFVAAGGSFNCAAAERSASKLAQGFSYRHDEVREKPWSVHIVKVDLSNPDFELHTTLGQGTRFGMATLSEQIRTIPREVGKPVAGINGDYYLTDRPYAGDPKGLQITRGELISAPCDWTCFWLDAAGVPHMTNVLGRFAVTWPNGPKSPFGLNEERASDAVVLYTAAVGKSTRTSGGREIVLERNGTNSWLPLRPGQAYAAQVREVREAGDTPLNKDTMVLSLGRKMLSRVPKVTPGTVLQISTATTPDIRGAKTAVGGGPPLVRKGKVIERNDNSVRHPRAAIGWNKQFFFLVEVDGRQRNLSVGMTDIELGNYLLGLGCEEAMSLDGGGSATFWLYGQVMNNPSEGRERPMGNALVVVQKDKK